VVLGNKVSIEEAYGLAKCVGGRRVDVAVGVLIGNDRQGQVFCGAIAYFPFENRVAEGSQRVRSEHRCGRGHRHASALHLPVRGHRDITTLRVTGDK
jgi:hypothetical protein